MKSINRNLPAGLIDDNIEFFNNPSNRERSFCLTGGVVRPINEAPEWVLTILDADMASHPIKISALTNLGYHTKEAQREKYCSCCFGAFDGQGDVVNGVVIHQEFWPCPERGQCPAEGKLCNGLISDSGIKISPRGVDILSLVGECELDKEMASTLGISEETVKIHKKKLYKATGLMNKMDLLKFAFRKNLVS